MIVGTKVVDTSQLRIACKSTMDLIKFSDSLVPRCLSHIEEIKNNQRYLVAIKVRQLQGIPYVFKQKLQDSLLENITIRGTLNVLIDLEDLMLNVNVDKILKELFKDDI